MKCRCCGSEMEQNEIRCSYCGTMLESVTLPEKENTPTYQDYHTTPQDVSYRQNTYQGNQVIDYQPYRRSSEAYDYSQYQTQPTQPTTQTTNSGLGTMSMVLGMLSIFFSFSAFGFIFAILSIVFGTRTCKYGTGIEQKRGKTGRTCGIVTFSIYGFFILLFIFAFFIEIIQSI